MARLEWRPIPDFVAEQTGQDYTIRNIKQYLVNPIGVGVTAEGFGGVSATISGNNLIISEFGTLTDNPYIVLTASRPASPSAYLPADTEIARTFINVRLLPKTTGDGQDGVGTEIIYAVTDQDSIPNTQLPDNSWGYNNGGSVGGLTWHTDPQSVSAATPNQFVAERHVIGTPDDGDDVDDDWSAPALWSNFAEDGEDGTAGDDGVGTETVYAVTNANSIPNGQLPNNTWGYGNGGTQGGLTWHATPPSVTASNPNLFAAQRTVIGTPNVGDDVDDTWSMPQLFSRYAEDGEDGVGIDGDDGVGAETLYAVTNANSIPNGQLPNNTWGYENGGTQGGLTWYTTPPAISATTPNLFITQRTVIGTPSSGDSVDDTWSTPQLFSRYAEDGEDGDDGDDGVGRETLYAITNANTIPSTQLPSNTWGYNRGGTQGGLTWHTTPQAVSSNNRNQFIVQRQVIGAPNSGDTVPDTWSAPALWSRYAQDGQHGIGTPGEDGVGTEIIYAVSSENALGGSHLPDNSWGYNRGGTAPSGTVWHTTPQAVSETNPNQFIATRQVIGTPADGENVPDTWSAPALWSNFAEDGEDGEDGTGGGAGEADLWDYGTYTRTRGNADVVDFSGATEVTGGTSETRDISPPLLPPNHSIETVRGTLTGKRESPPQIAVGSVTKNENMLRLNILKHRTDQAGSIQNMHVYFQGQYQLLQTYRQQSRSTASRRNSAFDKDNGIF